MRLVLYRCKTMAMIVVMAALASGGNVVHAETSEVRIGSGFGIHYLPFYVMNHERMVEKQAAKLGISDLKVEYQLLSGGAAYNDGILSGNLDIIGSGVGPFAVLWDKTKGKQDVRAIAAMGNIPLVLLTNDDRIKSLDDLRDGDKIAVPAVKSSMQATLVQIAAAKRYGEGQYQKLDLFTVSMTHSDAATAFISGSGVINMHFSVAPYSTRELESPNVRQISSAKEIIGGPMSFNIASTTKRFHDENPTVTKAVTAALAEAMEFIRKNPDKAATFFFQDNKGAATGVEMVEKVLADPEFDFTVVPNGVGTFVQFMQKIGSVKNRPDSWKDMFFEEAYPLGGN